MTRSHIAEKTVVDLFCGCGGFSLGAELAGFRTLAAIDIDPTLQSAYRRNFPRTEPIQASVVDLDASAWNHFLGAIRPDGVIGGPPCQGFSWIGQRQKDDPRNSLLGHFFRNVALLEPKFFIMENVQGLLDEGNAEVLSAAMTRIPTRYRILDPIVVNAADFGAPTTRQRVIVVGYDPSEVAPLSVDSRHSKYTALIEFSIEKYEKSTKKSLTDEQKKKFVPKLDDMIPFFHNNPDIWGAAKASHLKHSLANMGRYQPRLNGVLHNPFQPINRSEAFQIRDEVLPLLRHLIET